METVTKNIDSFQDSKFKESPTHALAIFSLTNFDNEAFELPEIKQKGFTQGGKRQTSVIVRHSSRMWF